MPNYAVQRRRGTTAQHATFTGLVGELSVDTDKSVVIVHDGSTAGGRAMLREDVNNLANDAISGDKVHGGAISGNVALSDGATAATQSGGDNSTKIATTAYVDTQITGEDLDVTSDSGTIAIDLNSETLSVSGGAGVDTSATGNAVTVALDYSATWAGNFIPDGNETRNLGSAAAKWNDLFLAGTTITLGTQTISEVATDDDEGVAGEKQISFGTDVGSGTARAFKVGRLAFRNNRISAKDDDIRMAARGVGNKIKLMSDTNVAGTLQMQSGKNITDSAGAAVSFGDNIHMNSNAVTNLPAPAAAHHATRKSYVDTLDACAPSSGTHTLTGHLVVTGDLTVSGDTTTVNTSTLAVEDNMIQCASGNAAASASYIGLQAERGATDAYWVWEESSDRWRSTTSTDGATHTDAAMQCSTLYGNATSANFADLAERYEADKLYQAGTVVCFGGTAEITESTKMYDTRVAGVISANPAHLMNAQAGTNETHPPLALSGRVPCKVMGTIRKGDIMVTSAQAGVAMAADERVTGTIIGKAVQDYVNEGIGVIEVLVTLM